MKQLTSRQMVVETVRTLRNVAGGGTPSLNARCRFPGRVKTGEAGNQEVEQVMVKLDSYTDYGNGKISVDYSIERSFDSMDREAGPMVITEKELAEDAPAS